ncbi:MAG: hypothetical protein PHF60_02840 [Candidatus ainarchaeum sp.]|nr:hypothetical protein [Candidatus ainarchaeum sp.]
MHSIRGKPPDGSITGAKKELSPDAMRIRQDIKRVFDGGLAIPSHFTCDPRSADDHKKLRPYLEAVVEQPLLDEAIVKAAEGEESRFVVGTTDKARQNPINRLGGREEAGDQAMKAHWNYIEMTVGLMSAINGEVDNNPHIIRISPTSDEGVIVMGGMVRKEDVETQFIECREAAKKMISLADYTYSIEVPYRSGSERFELDLAAFSRIMRHPGMVIAGDFALSSPIVLQPDAAGGFIQEELRKLENKEVKFYDLLPPCFDINGGVAEVITPFQNSLSIAKGERVNRGAVVEIKLEMAPEDAIALLRFTVDGWNEGNGRGTAKGHSEIFSRLMGMRGFNTFLGKARANSMLTPITQAMGDIRRETSIAVVPLANSYLQYWLELPPEESTVEFVRKFLERRLHSTKGDDPGYINTSLKPAISILDGAGLELSEARPRFILKALGRELYPVQVLSRTDFLLSFIENVSDAVQHQIFTSLTKSENGGRAVSLHDLDNMSRIRWICSHRRTIRDTEDLIWTLRMDDELPQDIKTKKEGLEDWLFNFAWDRFENMFYLLAKRIHEEKNRTNGVD